MDKEYFDTNRLNDLSIMEVARRLGDTLKREGSVYKTRCPWHEDSHPSLTFYERTGESRCHCFACGNGGSVISYVMQHEKWTFQEACQWLSNGFGILTTKSGKTYIPKQRGRTPAPQPPKPEYTYIPNNMVDEMVSSDNSLCKCLKQMFSEDDVNRVVEEYRIGIYSSYGYDDYTVFPNIDKDGRVCNLKIQHYETDMSSPLFAHKDSAPCVWLGRVWAKCGRLSPEAEFNSTCLFGEHLLSQYTDAAIALVESPKNALFGALAYPQMLWLATGNKGALKRETLLPLKQRDVIVIPDCDAVEEWNEKINNMRDLANFTVSDYCKRISSDENGKLDIADYIQGRLLSQ